MCPECGTQVPGESRYCMTCGALFKSETGSVSDAVEGLDLESRVLCPDGNCTGIIIDGKCSECGKPYSGSAS
jgi:DNA-directed RNA polymerase subunit RPC12/RpoP